VRKTAGGSWSSSVVVSDAAARPLAPLGFALRADGVAQVAWSDNRAGANTDIYSSQYSAGVWSVSALLSDDPGSAAQSSPALAYVGGELASAWRDDRGGNGNVRARRPAGDHFAYRYDGLNRLTGVSLLNAESFALDGVSNVTKRSGIVETYDAANRLTADGGTSNTWSNADRLVQRGAADIFGYDALDRLISSTVGGSARGYAYNGDGLLQSRSGAGATSFLWDPATSPSRELRQGSDNIVYGLGPLYVVKGDGSTLTFARDGGKSVRAEVNGSGAVTAAFRYKAYGQTVQSFGATAPTYLGYAGQLLDPSGLYYMRARWYDPVTGRFASRDRSSPSQTPTHLNAFAYALGNPVVLTDPTGLDPWYRGSEANSTLWRVPASDWQQWENEVYGRLRQQYPESDYDIVHNRAIRDPSTGRVLKDPETGRYRRPDFQVFERSSTRLVHVEEGSLGTARSLQSKAAQIASQQRINQSHPDQPTYGLDYRLRTLGKGAVPLAILTGYFDFVDLLNQIDQQDHPRPWT
jgi:RHS repeat-associated protein